MKCFVTLFMMMVFTLAGAQCLQEKSPEVLLVGDSWLNFPWVYKTHERVFREYGFSDIKIYGEQTAIGGTISTNWIMGNGKYFVTRALNTYKNIQYVVISIGGNDLIYDIRAGMSDEASQAIIDKQDAATRALIEMVKTLRPGVNILLCGYDYPNLLEVIQNPPSGQEERGVNEIYQGLFQITGKPDQEFVNSVLVRLEATKQLIANDYSNVVYVPTLGLMQQIYGYDSIFCSKYPSFLPGVVSVPGGDLRYPSPQKAMGFNGADAIHLSDDGFMHWVRYHSQAYFLPRFRGFPEYTFKANNAFENGTISSNGTLMVNQPMMGDQWKGANYKMLLSFDISSLPTSDVIENATLYLKRKSATSLYPILLDNPFFKIEVAANVFGNTALLESEDFNATAVYSEVVCSSGNTSLDGDVIKIKLSKEMILRMPKSGKIQFRLTLPANGNGISKDEYILFYGAGEAEYVAPYLDINTKTSTGVIRNEVAKLHLFPNPVRQNQMITLILPATDDVWHMNVMDIQGSIVYSKNILGGYQQFDVSGWNRGIYIVSVMNGNKVLTSKVVVQ